MSKKKSLLMSLILVLVMGLSITAGTFAYFQWSTGYAAGTQVNVTIEMGGIKMHIEPEATGFVGLYPTAHCENNVRYGDTLVRIENNTGALAVPSFKLKVKINPSVADTGQLDYYKEHVHYAVVALETTKEASGSPVKGNPVGGNILDNLVTGTCSAPLSVSSTEDTQDTFKSDYGKSATGLFNTITGENTFADTGFLPREYNSSTGEVSGVTFRGEAYSTSYQYYRVYVWIDEGYTTTIIGNNVTDPLQNAQIQVTWSENSMLQQVSGVSNVEPVLAAGLYDTDGNLTTTWDDLVENEDITVENNVITAANKELTGELVIPEGITEIGSSTFDSAQIESVVIPASVTSIGYGAFSDASLLNSIRFAEGSQVTSIGDYAFVRTSITSIEIPASVEEIGSGSFIECYYLNSVTFDQGTKLRVIKDAAFSYCWYLNSIEFKNSTEKWNSVTKEDQWNFGVPASMVVCSDGVTYTRVPGIYKWDQEDYVLTYSWDELIDNSAIEVSGTIITNASNDLTGSLLIIPEGITEIGIEAFQNSNITNVVVPTSVTNINVMAFYESSLSKITFAPNSLLTNIGSGAFTRTSLTNIEIPSNVTSISNSAFTDCTSLTEIKFDGTVEKWNTISLEDGWYSNIPATKVVCSNGEVSLQ